MMVLGNISLMADNSNGVVPTFNLDDGSKHCIFIHECSRKPIEGELPLGSWEIVQESPLTIRPSIHCLICGLHGFITNGEWVSI